MRDAGASSGGPHCSPPSVAPRADFCVPAGRSPVRYPWSCTPGEWVMVRATIRCVVAVLASFGAAGILPAAEPAPDVRAAVGKALPLLWKGAEGHVDHRTCFACHNQA